MKNQLWWRRGIACVLVTTVILGPFQMPLPALAALNVPSGNTSLINDDFEGVTDATVSPATSPVTTVAGYMPSFASAPNTDSADTVGIGSGFGAPNPSSVLVITDTNNGTISGSGSSATITAGSSSVQVRAAKTFSDLGINQGTITAEMEFWMSDISKNNYLFQIQGGANNAANKTDVLIDIQTKSSKVVWANSSGAYTNITPNTLTSKTWYHLKVVMDLTNLKTNFYVTPTGVATDLGTLIGQPFKANSSGSTVPYSITNTLTTAYAKSLYMSTGGSAVGQVAYDNIQVYKLNATPEVPAGLSAVAGNTQVAIFWSPAQNAATYEVLRGTSANGPFISLTTGITSAATQASPYNDFNLTNGTTYYYVVRAANQFGSTDSAPLAVTPSDATPLPQPPTGMTADVRDSAVMLKWNASSDASSYTLKRTTSLNGTYTVISSSLPASQTSYYDTALIDGTTYYYTWTSKNIAGIGPESAPVAVTPMVPLASPANLKGTATSNQVNLSWESVPSATSYHVKRSSVSGGPYTLVAGNITGLTYTDILLTNGTNYYYVVSTANSNAESMNTLEILAAPYNASNGVPAAPAGVTVTPGDHQVAIEWNAVSGAASYHVKRAASVAGPYTTIATPLGNSYVDTTVTNGTTYFYAVSSVNLNGEGAGSSAAIATPAHVIVVSKDNTGDFTTVQAAVNSIPTNNTTRQVIYIHDEYYYEKIVVDRPYISFVGESKDGTILAYDDYSCKPYAGGTPSSTSFSCTNAGVPIGDPILGTGNSYSLKVTASSFSADNLTILNTAFPRTVVAPAVALYVTGDKAIFTNIRLSGYQDTLYVNSGRQYYKNVMIEGDADWIFGNATVVFDSSEIKFDGKAGGHTTAASTAQGSAYGYVFLNSKLTRGTSFLKNYVTKNSWNPNGWDSSWDIDNNITATDGTVDLGRPWQPYANVKFINTWMDAQIKAVGWDNWGNTANESTASYGEYNSSGPGANPKGRYTWTKQLTSSEADQFTVQNILAGTDGWDPTLFGILPQHPQVQAGLKPDAPGGLSAAADNKQVSLSWDTVTGATYYTVKRSLTSGGPYTAVANGSETKYTDANLTNGTTYYYVVAAGNTAGQSADSPQVSAKPIASNAIVIAEVTSPTTVKVTLNQKLNTFNPSDFELNAALGTWYSLSANLSNKYFTLKKASTETNTAGNTVVVLETEQAIHPDATIDVPVTENPKSVPYLNAAYYTGDRTKDIQQAEYLLGWQMDHGGWYKYSGDNYKRAWDGSEAKADWKSKDGKDLGTIDNNATTNEILFLSVMYKETGDVRYKEAVLRGIEFLLKMQYASGGWAQVYPARGNYSDYVTFNDNAMMRVMNVLTMATKRQYPFNTDIMGDELRARLQKSLDQGLDYILKSQIVVNGLTTAWCAQHDPITYEPRGARAYEHPSISGSESVDIIKYLMALPNPSPEVKRAVDSALSWFDANKVTGMKYVSSDPNNVYFVADPNSVIWYRFYEIGTNLPIFSGRDGVIKHNILEIEAERRNGYAWAGTWPQKLLTVAKTMGYYEKRAYVKIVGNQSQTVSGEPLTVGELKRVDGSYQVIAPSAPVGLTAAAGKDQVILTWNSVTQATYYSVKRSTTSGGPYTVIGTDLNMISYVDLTATDGNTYYYVVTASNTGGESANSSEVSVDKTAPETIAIASPINGQNGWYITNPTLTLSASDNLSGVKQTLYRMNGNQWENYIQPITVSTEGINTFEYKSIDKAGNEEAEKSLKVKLDNTAPTLRVELDKVILWPPNHKLITVTASVYANDSISQIDSLVLTSIMSSEPDSGLGDEDQPSDIEGAEYGTFDTSFNLRAERSSSSERVYTVTYTATDKAGNKTTAAAIVTVPHDQSGK